MRNMYGLIHTWLAQKVKLYLEKEYERLECKTINQNDLKKHEKIVCWGEKCILKHGNFIDK